MQKLVVSEEYLADQERLDCVELTGDGCLLIDGTLSALTIGKLVNRKPHLCGAADILVTGAVKITVLDLAGDIRLDASQAKDADVDFRYGKETPDAVGCVFCRPGDGNRVTIYHPDGGTSVNGRELDPDGKPFTGTRVIDFHNDRDLRIFLQDNGGEGCLQKDPVVWNTILEERKRPASSPDPSVRIQGNIRQIQAVELEAGGEGPGRFYQLTTGFAVSHANSQTDIPENEEDGKLLIPVAHSVIVTITDEYGDILYSTSFFEESGKTRILQDITTEAFPLETLLGKRFTMHVYVTHQYAGGAAVRAKLPDQSYVFQEPAFQSYLNRIQIEDPCWKKPGKDKGTVMFLYGRKPSDNADFRDGDYWDENGFYHNNTPGHDGLRTIIPITGTVTLNQIPGYEVTGVSIDSYMEGDESYPPFFLDYALACQRIALVEFRKDLGAQTLGQAFQDNGDLTVDLETPAAHFDLKLPQESGQISPYDWHGNITGAFLNLSSHKCYLNGCFVLNVAHKPRMGSANEKYPIYIYSADELPEGQDAYFVSAPGSNVVYIPPITIYWGCYAKETMIQMLDGRCVRADWIRVGDKMMGFGGKILTVADILTGFESEIYRVTTRNGGSIRVSGGHAMKVFDSQLPEGRRVAAGKLKARDALMTPQGVQEVVSVTSETYGNLVYNFLFQGEQSPNYIEANGYWAGDFYAQNEEERRREPVLSEEDRARIEELKRFAKSFL